MIQNIRTFGTDPEVGLLVDNKLFPPARLFELGLSYTINNNNKKVIYKGNMGSIIEDGASFEFNTKPEMLATNLMYDINYLIKQLVSMARGFLYRNGIEFKSVEVSKKCVENFDVDTYLKNTGELYDECRVFRCDADFYPKLYRELGLELEDGVLDASEHPLRYFGGHIHIQNCSKNDDIYSDNAQFAPTVFDFLVGLANVLNVKDTVKEIKRMKVYGRPGRGRIQKYSPTVNGYEYRPPSNNWIFNGNDAKSLLFYAGIGADIVENDLASDFVDELFFHIPNMWEAIITMNKGLAKEMLNNAMDVVLNVGEFHLGEQRIWLKKR